MGFAFMYFGEKVASLYNQKGSPGQETSNNETGFKVVIVMIYILGISSFDIYWSFICY